MKNKTLKGIALLGVVGLCVMLAPISAEAGHKHRRGHSDWSVSIGGYGGGIAFGSHGVAIDLAPCYAAPVYHAPVYCPPPVVVPYPRYPRIYDPCYDWYGGPGYCY